MSLPPAGRVLPVILAAGFAVAHTQGPVFYSNQNQYLLHGLARAGYGHLSADWLANTADPTPVFSAGVAASYRVAGLRPVQAVHFGLLMAYFLAMWGVVSGGQASRPLPLRERAAARSAAGEGFAVADHPSPAGLRPAALSRKGRGEEPEAPRSPPSLLPFAALFTLAHAGIVRWLSVQLTGTDWPWFLQAGVANQYLLGPGLQPSAFGVLLVVSLAVYARGWPVPAGALAAAAGVVHPTYLLPAALLTLGYVAGTWPRCRRRAVGTGLAALLVAVPVVAFTMTTFPPTDTDYAESRRVLAEVRIPHHAVPARWFDGVAALQLTWIGVGLASLWKTRLFVPLTVAAAGGVLLTLAQLATGDHSLALLFPWRVSAVLVPVATAAVCARLAGLASGGREPPDSILESGGSRPPLARMAVVLLLTLVAGGVAVTVFGLGYGANEAERPLFDWVREHSQPGDVYLIPTRFPPVGAGRGVPSTTFLPPLRPAPGSNLIPVDLQRFRLATGVPIYADFKAIPYRADEVMEWARRVRQAEGWYAGGWDRDRLRAAGITHVVVPRDASPPAGLEGVYADEVYAVYRVKPAAPTP